MRRNSINQEVFSPKFSREDEQILALNYENLCDADYLQRLFTTDGTVVKEDTTESTRSTSESNLSSAEFPEDVIIFGDNVVLGKMLFERRLRKETLTHLKFQDGLSLQISRQSIIYEHMGKIMLQKLKNETLKKTNRDKSTIKGIEDTTRSNSLQIKKSALNSTVSLTFDMFDEAPLTSLSLKSVLMNLTYFFDPMVCENKYIQTRLYFEELRKLLLKKDARILPDLQDLSDWNKVYFAEEIKSSLYSIFCMLCIGLFTNEIADVVIAVNKLLELLMEVEMKSEIIGNRAKELAQLHMMKVIANNNNTNNGSNNNNYNSGNNNSSNNTSNIIITNNNSNNNNALTNNNAKLHPKAKGANGSKAGKVGGNGAVSLVVGGDQKESYLDDEGDEQQSEGYTTAGIAPSLMMVDTLATSSMTAASASFSSSSSVYATNGANSNSTTPTAIDNNNNNNTNNYAALKSVGSGSKLLIWEKNGTSTSAVSAVAATTSNTATAAVPTSASKSLETQRDSSKAKLYTTKNMKSEQRLLVDYLDLKDSVISNSNAAAAAVTRQQSIVVNQALVQYDYSHIANGGNKGTNKPMTACGNGSSSSTAATVAMKGEEAIMAAVNNSNSNSSNFTPRTSTRKIEKEMKDACQESLQVPQSVIAMIHEYCKLVGKTPFKLNNTPMLRTNSSTNNSHSSSGIASKGCNSSTHNKSLTRVWSCGQNSYGELGLGDVTMRKNFARIALLDDKNVVSIGAGNEHSLFVTKSGKLYTAGYNDNGQCGIGTNQQVKQPTIVQALEDEEIHQVFVYNGCEHTIALSREGKIFSFGYNYRGQLGLGNTNSESVPRPVRALLSRKVIVAACSYHHTIFLCSDGSLFACGRNDSGQLGHGDTVDKKTPQAILSAPRHVVSLSCGQFHTVISTAQGAVYVCGKNDFGQLGVDNSNLIKVLSKINVPGDLDCVRQVCCGYYHTLLLSNNGVISGFGRNDYGQLGLGHAQPKVFQCTIINHLRDKGVTSLAAGCYHSIAVTANGMLYVFGRNNHGQLATGDLDERHSPHPVDDFVGQRILAVSAGFYHTLILATDNLVTSPSRVTVEINVKETTVPTDLDSLDPKQLSTLFQKDLQLLGGDPAALSLKDNNTDSLSYVSSSDLLTILMKNMSCFLCKPFRHHLKDGNSSSASYGKKKGGGSKGKAGEQEEGEDEEVEESLTLPMVANAVNSIASILLTSWRILSGKAIISCFAIVPEDLLIFMCKLIAIASGTLEQYKKQLLSSLTHAIDSELGFHDEQLDKSSRISYLMDLLVTSSPPQGDSSSSSSSSNEHMMVLTSIQNLRSALLSVYFDINAADHWRSESENFSNLVCDLLCREYSILFSRPLLVLKFLLFLREKVDFTTMLPSSSSSSCNILSNSSSQVGLVGGQQERSIYLRLFNSIAKVYVNFDVVFQLFQYSIAVGMEIFSELNHVYILCSKRNIEKRLHTAIAMQPGYVGIETKRLITTLEQSISTILKVALPILLEYDGKDKRVHFLRETLLVGFIADATELVDLVIQKGLSEENLSLLRYGTLLPSILPTVLLSTLAFVRRGVKITILTEPLQALAERLEKVCKWETGLLSLKLQIDNNKRIQDSSSSANGTSSRKESLNATASSSAIAAADNINNHNNSHNHNHGKEDDSSDSLVEEILYIKKEQSQISWWYRLLKLSVMLLSKLNLHSSSSMSLMELAAATTEQEVTNNKDDAHADKQLVTFIQHPLWKFVMIDETNYQTRLDRQGILAKLSGQQTIPEPKSILLKQECMHFREIHKTKDTIYKMLSQSTQSVLSGSVIHVIEDRLYETIVSMQRSYVPSTREKYRERLFGYISKISKFIYSKRSSLVVSSANALSWVEILQAIDRIFHEICSFVTCNCASSYKLSSPLPYIKKKVNEPTRAKIYWRKACLAILCLNRWKLWVKHSIKEMPFATIEFIFQVGAYLTNNYTSVHVPEATANSFSYFYSQLLKSYRRLDRLADSLFSTARFYQTISFVSLRSDLLMSLTQTIKHSKLQELSALTAQNKSICLSNRVYTKILHSVKLLESILVGAMEQWQLSSGGFTVIDLQMLTTLIKLQETLFLSVSHLSGGGGNSSLCLSLPFSLCVEMIMKLHEKYRQSHIGMEENNKAATTKKGSTQRERNANSKKAAFAAISYMQSVVLSTLEGQSNSHGKKTGGGGGGGGDKQMEPLISSYCHLLAYLQDCRNHETFQGNGDEALLTSSTISSPSERDSNSVPPAVTATLTATPSAAPSAILLSTPLSSTAAAAFNILPVISMATTPLTSMRGGGGVSRDTAGSVNNSHIMPSTVIAASINTPNHSNNNNNTTTPSNTSTATTPATSSINNNNNNNSNKKRCQDLIIKPMEFSRSCEGVVVAGEKLLNNCKGTDYSMAMWILVTTHPIGSKVNFLLGKISHNEAWPLVLMKSDGKLEIVYGHNNEFEKLSSESSLPLFTWTHLSIVIESKKIKLFLNGLLDCQATSPKCNARAILFPLVIGTCPSQVRTHVSNVKDGFDGLIAQFKYYSRALSPIHVKFIFDHGPPELTDVTAKMIYHILSALKCIFLSYPATAAASDSSSGSSVQVMQKCLELSHLIFISDMNRRNRYAALQLMKLLLVKISNSSQEDFLLSGIVIKSGIADRIVQTPLSKLKFLPKGLTFPESFVVYLIRVIGLNWLQYLRPLDNVNVSNLETEEIESISILEELIAYTPRSCFSKSILDKIYSESRSNTPNNSISDRLIAQEEPYGETSYQLIDLLLTLAEDGSKMVWFEAIVKVMDSILNRFSTKICDCWKFSKVDMMEVVGCTLLLGGGLGGSYLGAKVKNFFDDHTGTIVQINHTVNGATTLTPTSSSDSSSTTAVKALKVRLGDFMYSDDDHQPSAQEGDSNACSTSHARLLLFQACEGSILKLLNGITPAIKLLSRDFLASNNHHAASGFQQKAFLKCLRPVESFLFSRLLTGWLTCRDQQAVPLLLVQQYPDLWEIINDTSCSSMEVMVDPHPASAAAAAAAAAAGSSSSSSSGSGGEKGHRSSSTLTHFWFLSMKYLSIVPEKLTLTSFPSDQEERLLIEFINRQLGFQDDLKTIGRQISTGGMLTKSLLATVPGYMETFDISRFELKYLITDKSNHGGGSSPHPRGASAGGASAGSGSTSASSSSSGYALNMLDSAFFTEQDFQSAWSFMQYLRNSIILACRAVIRQMAIRPDLLDPQQQLQLISSHSHPPSPQQAILTVWKMLAAQAIDHTSVSSSNSSSSSSSSGSNNNKKRWWIDVDTLNALVRSSTPIHQALTHFLTKENVPMITQFLAATVKFTVTSMLQPVAYKMKDNILLTTDYFTTLTRNLYLWLEFNLDRKTTKKSPIKTSSSSSNGSQPTAAAVADDNSNRVEEEEDNNNNNNDFGRLIFIVLNELLPCISSSESAYMTSNNNNIGNSNSNTITQNSSSGGAELKLRIMQICVYFIRRLLTKLLPAVSNRWKPSQALLEIIRGSYFQILRASALEQVMKFRGHNLNNISHHAYNITQLVAGLELLQRRASSNMIEHASLLRALGGGGGGGGGGNSSSSGVSTAIMSSGSSKIQTNLALARIQSITTPPPKLITVRANHVDCDLSGCAASSMKMIESMECMQSLLQGGEASTSAGFIDLFSSNNHVVIEVALGVGGSSATSATSTSSTTDTAAFSIFETIYCGTSLRLVQSGLLPDSLYQMKARAYFGSIPLSWSPLVEFRTEKGPLFTFDALKSGPDIIITEDGLTASYTGDDTWSTILGSRSFSSGVTSWELRINQSSTAYIFVGVATSAADLTSFLGGCPQGWGFIGEQALYHNREKVKVYGEAFTTGDIIGVTLDLHQGTLSFTKNKKQLGLAFDKIYGDLFPAIAFYNVGQEIQILSESFKTTCAYEPIPISPTRLSMDEISLLNELILLLYTQQVSLSHRLAIMVAEHCNSWCNAVFVRCRAISKKEVFLAIDSPLLKRFNLLVGERVRTYYGVAEVAGVAYNRVWFRVNPAGEVWFFTNQQILEGKTKKFFTRSSYMMTSTAAVSSNAGVDSVAANGNAATTTVGVIAPSSSQQSSVSNNASLATAGASMTSSSALLVAPSATGTTTTATSAPVAATGSLTSTKSMENLYYTLTFDAATVLDVLDPNKWSLELDGVLVAFLLHQSEVLGIEAWKMTCEQLYDNFRSLQAALTRVVLASPELTQRWGIFGPKRKAVIARLGLLRIFNQLLDMYLPFFLSDQSTPAFEGNKPTMTDDFMPSVESFKLPLQQAAGSVISQAAAPAISAPTVTAECLPWPSVHYSWDLVDTRRVATAQELWLGPLNSLRRLIFSPLKVHHFLEVLKKTATRPAKTEDDYDYPENLPHVKINRLKAFRAREAADLHAIPGEDVLLSTMFCQLWRELRQHNSEKLRISYTHPMDDGQARTFKIKFEGEGVDDYGGPYREIFQQICTEIQLIEPLLAAAGGGAGAGDEQSVDGLDTSSQQSLEYAGIENSHDLHPAIHSHHNGLSKSPSLTSLHTIMDTSSNFLDTSNLSYASMTGGGGGNMLRCFLPLLMPTPNWTTDSSECQEKYRYMFHPAATSSMKRDLFTFLGQLVGIAIRSKITLDLALPSYLWKCIVGERLLDEDLASFDQSAYNMIKHLSSLYQHYSAQQDGSLSMTKTTHEEFGVDVLQDITWSATRSDGVIIDLIPQGRQLPVEIQDLGKYLTLYTNCRFEENKMAVQLFRKGLVSIIPESAITLLTWEELEGIICGSKTIDIDRLRENTEYDDDVSPEDAHIMQFWEVLTEFTEEEKSAFLKFVWARPTLPPRGVEFTQKMRILSASSEAAATTSAADATTSSNAANNNSNIFDGFLPKAHTCFFSINLPKYSSKKIMADKLRYAILNCTEMDGDFRTTEIDVPGWGPSDYHGFPDESSS